MVSFKLNVLALATLLIVSVGFSSYSYRRDKKVNKLSTFIKNASWQLKGSEWNENKAKLDLSSYSIEFKNKSTYRRKDLFAKVHVGNWKLKEIDRENFIVLDEGTPVEETYKVVEFDIKDNSLRLERINSSSGFSNVIYEFGR